MGQAASASAVQHNPGSYCLDDGQGRVLGTSPILNPEFSSQDRAHQFNGEMWEEEAEISTLASESVKEVRGTWIRARDS